MQPIPTHIVKKGKSKSVLKQLLDLSLKNQALVEISRFIKALHAKRVAKHKQKQDKKSWYKIDIYALDATFTPFVRMKK